MKNTINFKKIFAFMTSVILTASFVSCGDKDSDKETSPASTTVAEPEVIEEDDITEEQFDKAAEKLESMTEEEFEKAVENGGLDLGEDEPKETEPEPEPVPVGYQPTEEILNADFTSGLIQIGNDVFQCGGYITLGDFVEKYKDNWDFFDSDGKELNLDTPLNKDLSECNDSDPQLYITANSKQGNLSFRVQLASFYDDTQNDDTDSDLVKERFATEFNQVFQYKDAGLDINSPFVKYIITHYWAQDTMEFKETYTSRHYPYAEDATYKDAVVLNCDVSDLHASIATKDAIFYPGGISKFMPDYEEKSIETFFETYLNTSGIIDYSEILGGKSYLTALAGFFTQSDIKGAKFLHVAQLEEGKIIKIPIGYNDVSFSNVTLKDKNLLGFNTVMNVCYAFNYDWDVNSSNKEHNILYCQFMLEPDKIYPARG